MVLAVRTSASPTAIWVICAVAVACLAFWLIMVMVYAAKPSVRHRRMPRMTGPVLGGMHVAEGGRSVAPNRELPAVLPDLAAAAPAGEAGRGVPAQRAPGQRGPQAPAEPAPAGASAPAGSAETVPAQRTAPAGTTGEAPTEPIPAQRTADADTTADTGAAGRH
jgi:hypothetical protein